MTTDNHTAIASGAAADAATFNSPLAELDAIMGDFAAIDVTGSPASIVAAINQNRDDMGAIAATTVAGSPATVVAALNSLQTFIGVVSLSETLKAWSMSGAFELTAVTYYSAAPGVVSTATVKWPDGSAGVYTTTTLNTTHRAVDAYTITHTESGLTVTQTAVTRDLWGNETVKPAITVA